jgi:hypothetical protein
MTTYEIRTLGGKVIHEVEVGDRKIAYPPDLRGLDFTNANLCGAQLSDANFEGAILLGADFTEACLHKANLKNADARYCDFTKANLRETNLENAQMYPSETIGAKFYGAKFLPDSDAAYYARIAHEEMIKKMRIHPKSFTYGLLQRINRWTSTPAPSPDTHPERRYQPRRFVEGLS